MNSRHAPYGAKTSGMLNSTSAFSFALLIDCRPNSHRGGGICRVPHYLCGTQIPYLPYSMKGMENPRLPFFNELPQRTLRCENERDVEFDFRIQLRFAH